MGQNYLEAIKIGSKMDQIRIGSTLGQKRVKVGLKLDQNWVKIGSQLDQNWIKIGSK